MIPDVAAALRDMIRIGKVVNTYPETGRVRVKFHDTDNATSYELQVLYPKTHKDKAYFMYDQDELVLCVFLGNGPETGFVVGAIYNDLDKTPKGMTIDKRHLVFEDGTWIEYDRKAHFLKAEIKGKAEIKVQETLRAEVGQDATVEIGGNLALKVGGLLTIKAANVTVNSAGQWIDAAGINSGTHVHTNVASGLSTSGPPT
jgi:phage baseplate assembly protein V